MNKKNFPIFISLLIVSLFFTVIFYYGYSNINNNKKTVMSENYFDASILEPLSKQEIEKLNSIEDVKHAGGISIKAESARFKDDILAVNYQDKNVNLMREYSDILEGEFPNDEHEIILSKTFVDDNKLKLGDTISLELGKRIVDEKEINAESTNLNNEIFNVVETKNYKLVGIYQDVYNKYSNLHYALTLGNEKDLLVAVIKFKSFEDAYKNRDSLQASVNEKLGKEVSIRFDDRLINYYRVEQDSVQKLSSKAMMIFSVLVCLFIFIFFIKNVFWVWGIRKIRELSVYKSIGTTDFQIYKILVKEAIWISLIPIFLGHILGYLIIKNIYENVKKIQDSVKFYTVDFSLMLSLVIIFIALLVVMFALMSPARRISKINIIDGIKGNIDFNKSKKRKSASLWKELKLNSSASIKSQRYISAIGIIIISIFLIVVGISRYFTDFEYFDSEYNVKVDLYNKSLEIPQVLKSIEDDLASEKSYISNSKYVSIKNNLELSNEAKASKLDKEIEKQLEKYEKEDLEGFIIALEEKDFEKIGGTKGDYILYNQVQKDPYFPISKAEKIPFFKNPSSLDISIGKDFTKTINISKNIEDLGNYESRTMPFQVKIYTDFDTFFQLMKESKDEKNSNNPFELLIKVNDTDTDQAEAFIDEKIKQSLSVDERYMIVTGDGLKKANTDDVESMMKIILAIALIIFILNVTNGYSSINLSLMSRKKEIGTLYSCGMDILELKSTYEKEFFLEQVKAFIISIMVTLIVTAIISIISPILTIRIILRYFDWKIFIIFSMIIYLINIIMYKVSLNRILERPTIELIKVI